MTDTDASTSTNTDARSGIEWSEQLSIGIDSIDRQHKTLISYINELNNAINKDLTANGKKDLVTIVINKLVNYTRIHFVYEEAIIFGFSSYPEAADHKEKHEKLFKGVDVFKERIQSVDINDIEYFEELCTELMMYMNEWLTNHILIEDMQYAIYIKENGIKVK
ncbi:MAG: hemerythrin family protein [Methylococcales bacterium]|nr:hemerythrin family protein [Methylococcales bacterium]